VQIFQTKPAFKLAGTDIFPGHKTLGPMAGVISSPEESAATAVNSFDDRFVQPEGRHIVERKGTKDTGTQSKAPGTVQKGSTPTREVPVTRSNEGLAISNGKLMRRKRKAKIGLWEGRN